MIEQVHFFSVMKIILYFAIIDEALNYTNDV